MSMLSEKSWLRAQGVRPRKQWGQHFLVRPAIAARMLAGWQLPPRTRVLEIGAGAGAITLPLLRAGCRVAAIERDPRLCALLRARVAAECPTASLTLVTGDLLAVDPAAPPLGITARGSWVLVGNLPYAITSQILEWSVRHKRSFRWASFMVQREYAERLRAGPGSRTYGSLSVWIGYHFAVERELRVGPEAFWPVPKVASEVIRLRPRARPPVVVPSDAALQRIVRAAFAQRRKMLLGALAAGLGLPRVTVAALLAAAQVDGRWRAEACGLEQFAALARALCAVDPGRAAR